MKTFLFTFLFIISLRSQSQDVIIPGVGIRGFEIKIDTSSIQDVMARFGSDCKMTKYGMANEYYYPDLGLCFSVYPIDANRIVRVISLQAPFKAITTEGIELNQSSMGDVINLYKKEGCFIYANSVERIEHGISYCSKKGNQAEGFDKTEKIFEIKLYSSKDWYSSRVNFKFNEIPGQEILNDIIDLLRTGNSNYLKSLDELFAKNGDLKNNEVALFRLSETNRILPTGLTQYYLQFVVDSQTFELMSIDKNDTTVYISLSNRDNDSTLFVVSDQSAMNRVPHFELVKKKIEFGTFCGIDGSPPETCRIMLDLVKSNNQRQLINWMNSPNPEFMAYGYMGIKFIEYKGYEVELATKSLMNELAGFDHRLIYCSGCSFDENMTFSDFSELDFKSLYNQFSQTGWLK